MGRMRSSPWRTLLFALWLLLFLLGLLVGFSESTNLGLSHAVTFFGGLIFVPILRILFKIVAQLLSHGEGQTDEHVSLYSLAHSKLNLKLSPPPMWMNMGYWKSVHLNEDGRSKPRTLAEASRNLLSKVLKTAGFDRSKENPLYQPKRTLIDLGFGCGEQTIYLRSPSPIKESDYEWWDDRRDVGTFTSYVGITKDKQQFRYAEKRIDEFEHIVASHSDVAKDQATRIFCADAADPEGWDGELQTYLLEAVVQSQEVWVLALDTLYHFSPSRWPVIRYACRDLHASFMAFDLCLADNATSYEILLLRAVTALMGAPWMNFVTKGEYRKKLLEIGYDAIQIEDISEHVFAPLADFLGEHDRHLQAIGSGLGSFHVARRMFGWWARSGLVRGVIVVARKGNLEESQISRI